MSDQRQRAKSVNFGFPAGCPMPRANNLGPKRRLFGLTWIGWLNFLFLRWFFVRLAYQLEPDNTVSRHFLRVGIWPIPWSQPSRVDLKISTNHWGWRPRGILNWLRFGWSWPISVWYVEDSNAVGRFVAPRDARVAAGGIATVEIGRYYERRVRIGPVCFALGSVIRT